MSDSRSASKLPRLSVDISPLVEDHWTGIPVFTRRLVQALLRHGGLDLQFTFRLTQIPAAAVHAAIRVGSGTLLRAEFERNAGSAYPLVDAAAPLLFPSVKEFFQVSHREASTIHDVSTLMMPENHDRENVDHHMRDLARQLATDDRVFCVSDATRAALTLAYPSVAEKTRILHQYVDWPEHFEVMDRNLPVPVLGRYAAVIGTLEPRKNLSLLMRAMQRPEIKDSGLRFVVMGRQGWNTEDFASILTPGDRERLLFTGFVTEFMKYRLLRHAQFLVYPSIYEGFGIPALEAMSLGKPVLAARTSSLPEVIGDAGVYFDPLSVTEFAAAFGEIAHEDKLAELSPKASARAGLYDWTRMAEPVVQWVKGD
jgi:glycosyltransferase involved in cell wall biosynthesis